MTFRDEVHCSHILLIVSESCYKTTRDETHQSYIAQIGIGTCLATFKDDVMKYIASTQSALELGGGLGSSERRHTTFMCVCIQGRLGNLENATDNDLQHL